MITVEIEDVVADMVEDDISIYQLKFPRRLVSESIEATCSELASEGFAQKWQEFRSQTALLSDDLRLSETYLSDSRRPCHHAAQVMTMK